MTRGLSFGILTAFILPCCVSAGDPASAEKNSLTLGPKLVTMTVKATPLPQVLADIKRQTGIDVAGQLGEPEPVLTLELKQTPFWKALDSIANQLGAQVVLSPRANTIVLTKRLAGQKAPITSYSGPVRLCIKRIVATNNFETGQAAYKLDVEVGWEPGLKPLFLETKPQGVSAVDDTGKRHFVANDGRGVTGVDGRISFMVEVPLPAVPRSVSTFTRIEGQLEAVAPSRMLQFKFPTLAKDQEFKEAGVACRIDKVTADRSRWIVAMRDRRPARRQPRELAAMGRQQRDFSREQGRQAPNR